MPPKASTPKYIPIIPSIKEDFPTKEDLPAMAPTKEVKHAIQPTKEDKIYKGQMVKNTANQIVEENCTDSEISVEKLCQMFEAEVKLEGLMKKKMKIFDENLQSNEDDISMLEKMLEKKKADQIGIKTMQGQMKKYQKQSEQNMANLKKKLDSLNVELPEVESDPTETHLDQEQEDFNNMLDDAKGNEGLI